MSRAGKILALVIGGGIVSGLVYGAVNATESANTAESLSFDIDSVSVKEILKRGILPVGVIYTFAIQVTNPTSKTLSISKLNVMLSIKNKGALSKIASSLPSTQEQEFSANKQVVIKHDIEVRFANVLPVLPNFVSYVIDRLRGAKSTQQAIADIKVDSMGLTIPLTQTIAL